MCISSLYIIEPPLLDWRSSYDSDTVCISSLHTVMSGAVRSEVCEGADTFLPVLIVGTIASPPQVQCRPQSCLWYWRYHPPALRGLKVLPTAGQTSNYSTYTTNSIYILYTPFTRHFSQTTITVNRQRAISELGATSLAKVPTTLLSTLSAEYFAGGWVCRCQQSQYVRE